MDIHKYLIGTINEYLNTTESDIFMEATEYNLPFEIVKLYSKTKKDFYTAFQRRYF